MARGALYSGLRFGAQGAGGQRGPPLSRPLPQPGIGHILDLEFDPFPPLPVVGFQLPDHVNRPAFLQKPTADRRVFAKAVQDDVKLEEEQRLSNAIMEDTAHS